MKKFLLFSILLMMLAQISWATETGKLTLEECKGLQGVANDFQLMAYLAWEIEEALVPYYEGNFELAKYTFSHVIKILEFYADNKEPGFAVADLALVYLRLGKIAEHEGKTEVKQEYYAKGTALYNEGSGKNYSTQRLVEFIEKVDSDPQNRVRQFPTFGDAIAPNQALKRTE